VQPALEAGGGEGEGVRHGDSPIASMLQLLPGSGTAAGVFRDLDLISRSITPRQAAVAAGLGGWVWGSVSLTIV
jgi:hypothetical protein